MNKDGGPAFPNKQRKLENSPYSNAKIEVYTWHTGMSLRDYFASQALSSLLSDVAKGNNAELLYDLAAEDSYKFADAMLKERSKHE